MCGFRGVIDLGVTLPSFGEFGRCCSEFAAFSPYLTFRGTFVCGISTHNLGSSTKHQNSCVNGARGGGGLVWNVDELQSTIESEDLVFPTAGSVVLTLMSVRGFCSWWLPYLAT